MATVGTAWAQTPPDAGRLLQDNQPTLERPTALPPPIVAPQQSRPASPAVAGDIRVQVSQFTFVGNAAVSTAELERALAPWVGKSLNFGELIECVESVEARYKSAGFFLAQAYLPPQKIRDGIIEISVSEGRLGETRLEGESRIAPDVLYAYVDRLPRDEPLQLPQLERQVLLLNELAGGKVSLDLQAGDKAGTTDIVLVQKEDTAANGKLEANNHGLPSTGEKRMGLTLSGNSPFGRGERISFNAMTSETRGLTSYNLRGDLPLGSAGWKVFASAARAEYSLGGAFASLKASGQADTLRLGASYPLLRSRTANLRLQVDVDHNRLNDNFSTFSLQLGKQSRGITTTLSGDWQDDLFGPSANRVDLALRSGKLSLGETAAQLDAPPAGPGTAGHFAKLNLTAQRLQYLSPAFSLQMQLTGQYADKNLDSMEKFSLGGPLTLPGYASSEAVADMGLHAKLGLRWQTLPELAITTFTDYAEVRLLHTPLAATTRSNNKRLSDAGIAADLLLDKRFIANATVAWAGRDAPNATDNDRPRFWFSLGYLW
ncbi:MAG: hypothetical protein RIR00_2655 [Pseudomonadota bacterium]|jgi:hemolysin activation/secretion protein